LFLLSRGLDLFQASVVPAVFFLVSVVFEVPTGAFADLAGRKTAFLLSCLIRMLAFGLYAFLPQFPPFLAPDAVVAAARAPRDGGGVDAMQQQGSRQPTTRFFARAQIFARIAIMSSGFVGGYLAQRDMTLPWLAAATSFAVTGAVAVVLMVETGRAPRTEAV